MREHTFVLRTLFTTPHQEYGVRFDLFRLSTPSTEIEPPPVEDCANCKKAASMVVVTDNSKSVTDNYEMHDDLVEVASEFVESWYNKTAESEANHESNALFCRFSNRLQD